MTTVFALVLAALPAAPADTPPVPAVVSYYRDVRSIFQQHCQGCHQPARPQGGYVMTSHADLFKKSTADKTGVVAGKPGESQLIHEILPHGEKPPRMPKNRPPLAAREVEIVKSWIAQGAKDDTPASDRTIIDADHPPVYDLPPVVTALACSPDGKLLAVSGYHEVLLHQADGSSLAARLVGLSERIESLAFSPDGKLLAAAGGSPGRFGEVQIWDVADRKLRLSHTITYDTLYGVSWSPDGKLVAFGCADNTLRAIEASTAKQVLFQGAHSDWVLGSVFSREGTHLVSVSRDRSMKLTEVATQRFIDNVTSITPGALKGGLMAVARRPIKDRKMSKVPPDTPKESPQVYDELLTGGSDGVPRLYLMHRERKRIIGDDFNKLRDYEGLPGRIFALSFNADGSRFVVGSSLEGGGEARVYQTDDGKLLTRLQGQAGAVYAAAFHPEGKLVVTAGFDGKVRINDAQTGKLVKEFVAVPLRSTRLVTVREKP
jgi:WD40 repeat protein/mono/diheme cytochrome c family protein